MVQLVTALMLLAAEPAAPVSPEVKPAEPVAAAPAAEPAKPPADAPSQPAGSAPAATPAPAPAAGAAPAAAPAPVAAVPEPIDPNAPRRFYVALGLGRVSAGGEVVKDSPMNDLTGPMGQIELTGGFRITPRWLVGLFLTAAGGGTPGKDMRDDCAADGQECVTFTSQVGVEGRYVFNPSGAQTWWAGAGLGGESTGTRLKKSNADRSYLSTYSGAVFPRLSAGWDYRTSRNWGWGFYGSLSMGQFDKVSTGGADPVDLPGKKAGHSWLGLGVKLILFP